MVLGKAKEYVKKGIKNAGKLAIANPGATYAMATKALSMAKFIASVINVEHKFKDTVFTRTNIYSTPSISFISGTSQGDAQSGSRNGDSIKLSSVNLRGMVTIGSALATNPQTNVRTVRVMLINDKVSDGSAPALSDVLDNSTLPNVYARYNPDNMGARFRIMYDKRFVVSQTTNVIKFQCYRKLKHHLKYTGSTANQADASTGHLYVLVVSDDNSVGTDEPQCEWNSCIRYIDN